MLPQSMPPAPRTVPEPSPELATSRVKRIFAKTAVTASSASIVSVQGPVPVHAPLQWSNFDPAAGVAVNVTLVPCGYDAEQFDPQSMPVADTAPSPASDTVN